MLCNRCFAIFAVHPLLCNLCCAIFVQSLYYTVIPTFRSPANLLFGSTRWDHCPCIFRTLVIPLSLSTAGLETCILGLRRRCPRLYPGTHSCRTSGLESSKIGLRKGNIMSSSIRYVWLTCRTDRPRSLLVRSTDPIGPLDWSMRSVHRSARSTAPIELMNGACRCISIKKLIDRSFVPID